MSLGTCLWRAVKRSLLGAMVLMSTLLLVAGTELAPAPAAHAAPVRGAPTSAKPIRPGSRAAHPAADVASVVSGPVTSGETGFCLADTNDSGAPGNKIQIWGCLGNAAQSWALWDDGTLRVAGGCATASGGGTANGTLIVLEPCSPGDASQVWRAGAHWSLVNPGSGKCLDDTGGSTTNGTQMELLTCNAALSQEWRLPQDVTGYVTNGVTAKCIDDAGDASTNGTQVEIWSCNGAPAQSWTVANGWAIQINGACLEPSGAGTAGGTGLVIETCDNTSAQQWAVGPNGWIWNVNAAKCASDPSAATTNGTQLIITGCASPLNAQQTWRPPQALSPAGALTSEVSGECADNSGGTKMVIFSCNGTGAEIWTVNNDGTIRTHDGLCAALSGGSTASGTLVVLGACTGTVAQQWAVGPAGSWVTAVAAQSSQYCLTDPSNSMAGLTQLDIVACSGATGQTWTLPPTTLPSAPGGVAAAPGDGQASVTWVAPWSDGGSPITSYMVTASPGGATATTSGTSVTVGGLTNGTSYTFTVTAATADGRSAASAASGAVTPEPVPSAPTWISMSPQYWASDGNLYTASTTPSFTAKAPDPAASQIQYQVEILSGSTVVASGTTGFVTPNTSATWADTTPLTDDTLYSYQVRAYDGSQYGAWSYNQPFTVVTDTPAAVTLSCTGYPTGTWSVQISGGTTCTWSAPLPYMNGYVLGMDGKGWWTTGTSTTINPGPGLHTLTIRPQSAAATWGPTTGYTFGVGTSGAMMAPDDGSQTSTSVSLQAAAPTGYTQASFYYRLGTTGSFQQIPDHVVYNCNCPVTWPVTTSSNSAGVQTPLLTWYVTRTVADDGPVQIQAVFTNGSGGTDTTPPVTVTLDRIGTGADYGTTNVGPVMVGLQSGNAAVSATDASINSYGSDLTVTRTFNSLEPAKASIFGPGWTSSITGGVTSPWTQLTNSGSYAVLDNEDGSNETFLQGSTNGSTVSWTPQGTTVGSGLTLTENTGTNTFTLTDSARTVTQFAASAATSSYAPATVTVPGDPSSAGFVYDTNSSDAIYGDPLLIVAPDAASSSSSTNTCPYPASASNWTAGCRGLQFTYSAGAVSRIDFVYVDNSDAFHDVTVADYSYDSAGRLTSEWDPRLATPLVNRYTYDETASDADYGRITQITPAQAVGSGALAPWNLTYDDTSGDVNYGKVLTVSRTHSATYGGATATTTIDYSVPLSISGGGPIDMDASTVGNWDQTDTPASAVAIFPPEHVPSGTPTVSDYQYAQLDYYDANGRNVNTASYINGAWAVSTTQYDNYGHTIFTLSPADRATALASNTPAGTASEFAAVNIYGCDNFGVVGACTSGDQPYQVLTDTYGPAHNANVDGTIELIRAHTSYSYDSGAPNSDTNADGSPYMLVTAETHSASIGTSTPGSATADARTTNYSYGDATTSIGWTLGTPLSTVTDPSGLDIGSTTVLNTNSGLYNGANLQTDSDMPSDTAGGGAGDTQTIYYTAGSNPMAVACGNRPEWADLRCQTGPAAQPGTSGLPPLPVTTYTYDDYLNVVAKTETYGSTGSRTTTTSYDSAERESTHAIAVTGIGMGTAIPETKQVYSSQSGLLTDSETLDSAGNVATEINTGYDDFSNALSYTDASGNATSDKYDIADRVTSINDSKGTEAFTYTGAFPIPSQIVDSQAGVFTATYNPDGDLATETYPGGVIGTHSYDATGAATALSYTGTNWNAPLTDIIMPNSAGDWASQSITDSATSLASTQAYTYDNADRLTSVQDTSNEQCATRAYSYDADSNRLSLTSYNPGSTGACQSSIGTSTSSTYDSADRGTNTGYTYDTQGDITTTPSADAGGGGNLTATYYVNDMLAGQTQNGSTITWTLDPTQGRTGTYTQGGTTYTDHYSDSDQGPAWVSGNDGSWTRNVTDLIGSLLAEVNASGVTLQLPDLHGNVMAIASTSSTATGPSATYVYTEFGTPETGNPGTYGWLGSDQISSDALGGQLLMGARAYNVGTGRFSQTDPIPGGSANSYDYGAQNPIINTDTSGLWYRTTWLFRAWGWSGNVTLYFSQKQLRAIMQGALMVAAAILGGMCSLITLGIGAVFCAAAVSAIGWYIEGAAAAWRYYSWTEIWVSYGIHWLWGWIPYPYFHHVTYR